MMAEKAHLEMDLMTLGKDPSLEMTVPEEDRNSTLRVDQSINMAMMEIQMVAEAPTQEMKIQDEDLNLTLKEDQSISMATIEIQMVQTLETIMPDEDLDLIPRADQLTVMETMAIQISLILKEGQLISLILKADQLINLMPKAGLSINMILKADQLISMETMVIQMVAVVQTLVTTMLDEAPNLMPKVDQSISMEIMAIQMVAVVQTLVMTMPDEAPNLTPKADQLISMVTTWMVVVVPMAVVVLDQVIAPDAPQIKVEMVALTAVGQVQSRIFMTAKTPTAVGQVLEMTCLTQPTHWAEEIQDPTSTTQEMEMVMERAPTVAGLDPAMTFMARVIVPDQDPTFLVAAVLAVAGRTTSLQLNSTTFLCPQQPEMSRLLSEHPLEP